MALLLSASALSEASEVLFPLSLRSARGPPAWMSRSARHRHIVVAVISE
jgi:hypothetical protein